MFSRMTIMAASLSLLTPGVVLAAPIHDAAAAGDVAAVMSLIKGGVSPNALDEAGETPLIVASRTDRKEVANVLVQLGADARIASPNGTTPLHAAALTDDANLIYVLTGVRPDVNARDADGDTPLMLAAEAGKGQAVTALRLDNLADLEVTDNAGRTALTRAGLKGQKLVVNILIRYGAVCQTIDPVWLAQCTERRKALGKS
jgi:ankyrin repeat protein